MTIMEFTLKRRRRLLAAAAYGLTSSLIAPATFAGDCDLVKSGYRTADYRLDSAMPYTSARYVPVGMLERDSMPATPQPDIVELASKDIYLNTLLVAIRAAGLAETLSGDGPFTVFAPTNEAFAAVPRAQLEALIADEAGLRNVLAYHVLPGRVTSAEVAHLDTAQTLNGQSVRFDTSDGVRVNGARVLESDIVARNGVIHLVDQVILPN